MVKNHGDWFRPPEDRVVGPFQMAFLSLINGGDPNFPLNWDDPVSDSYRDTRKVPKVGLSVKIITLERWGHFIVSIH